MPSTRSSTPGRPRSVAVALALTVVTAVVMALGACSSSSSSGSGASSPVAASPGAGQPSVISPGESASGGPTGPVQGERRDMPYVDDGNPAHTLDLYLPDDGVTTPYPLVIFVHGGGWQRGDKSGFGAADMGLDQYKTLLLSKGYAAASINYRLSGEATFPANIDDVKAAVRYLRGHARDLGVDPNRFAIIGESAGAQLALLLGMTAGDASLEGDLGTTGVSSAVQAVVSYYGFSDLRVRSQQLQAQGCPLEDRGTSSEGLMLGAEPSTDTGAALAAQASPITHVDRSDPPTLLFHGTQDCTAPTAQSKDMEAALQAAGVPTELRLIDAGHADAAFYVTPDLQDLLIRFLGEHLTGG